jgi:hypothetical protein
VLIKEFQGSLYCCVQVPGTPPVPGATYVYDTVKKLWKFQDSN